MIVLRWTIGGSYLLTELDGTVSKLQYVAFSLLPYYPRTKILIPVTDFTRLGDQELDNYEVEEDVEHDKKDDGGSDS